MEVLVRCYDDKFNNWKLTELYKDLTVRMKGDLVYTTLLFLLKSLRISENKQFIMHHKVRSCARNKYIRAVRLLFI